jgi:hypothetical protein
MKSILPIIFIVLVLTGAITYSLAKRAVPQKPTESIGISANQLENESTLTPSPTVTTKVTFGNIAETPAVAPAITPTAMPAISEKDAVITTKGGLVVSNTKVTNTTICTPVYGSADTCTEHVVVDTGAESAMFFNFAGLAYIGGLLSFVKAKSLKK